MTSLAGFLTTQGDRAHAAGAVAAMLSRAPSRFGPPSTVTAVGGIAIGRRFHPALLEDAHDRGVVSVAGGAFLIAADVRLDDRGALAAAIGIDRPQRWSDADLVAFGWERWGANLVPRLYGEFALAVWDVRAQRLHLARDPLGQQPLVFAETPRGFAFASMPAQLHALPDLPRRPAIEAIMDMLALIPEAGEGTAHAGVSRVMPGHIVTVDAGGVRQARWWQPDTTPLTGSAEDHAEELRDYLDRAVAARLRGVGSLAAAQLSGGFDSAAVADSAARIGAARGLRLVAYTAVPARASENAALADEGPLAALVAGAHANVDHHRIATAGLSPLDTLDRSVAVFDRPVRNLCNAPWGHAINDAARDAGATVLLTGQLGNLTLSHTGSEALAGWIGRGRLLRATREACGARRHGTGWGTLALGAAGPFLPRWAWRGLQAARGRGFDLSDHSALRATPMLRRHLARRIEEWDIDPSGRPPRNAVAARLWSMRGVDPGAFVKGWRGHWGLELRDPTADRAMIEFCLRVPAEHYWHRGEDRLLARRALAGRLHAALLAERRRGYQTADWHVTMRADAPRLLAEVRAIAAHPLAHALLDTETMTAALTDLPGDLAAHEAGYRWRLLRGVSAGHFLRGFA